MDRSVILVETARGHCAEELLDLSRQGRVLGAAAREFVKRITGQTATVIV